MSRRLGLWRQADFRNLWLGTTMTLFGGQVAAVALPLTAALTLHASPAELGVLSAMAFVPYLLMSLHVGVWFDRRAKRRTLVVVDLCRAAVLAVVPVAAWTGRLDIGLLLAVAFGAGVCEVVADIGGLSFLPFVVARDDIAEGNSKLELSNSAATVSGGSIGGLAVQLLTAPFAMLFNVVTALLSAACVSRIRAPESPPPVAEDAGMLRAIKEGARFVTGHPVIRALVSTTLVFNLFTYMIEPIFILFMTRQLDLHPFVIGLIFSSSGVGSLIGALIATSLARRLGYGPVIVSAIAVAVVTAFLVPLAAVLPGPLAVADLVVMHVLDAASIIVYNVNQRTLRTTLTPAALQGRMNASIRLVVMGVAPLGTLAGGFLGGSIGLVPTLVAAAFGLLLALIPIGTSRVPRLRALRDLEAVPETVA
ncbi:MFS transporter [Streptomyces sp. NPDC046985]|uniref:MFS transporter n=1 Tax=Streptomyces sp. NPDC046985 TaxID=3155377 RepID=UPI00340CCEF4